MRPKLAALLLLSGLVTAAAIGPLLGMTLGLFVGGPTAMFNGLLLGVLGIPFSFPLGLPAALAFGSPLWLLRVRRRLLWAGAGVLAGLLCFGLALVLPGYIREAMGAVMGADSLRFGLACAIVGGLAGLLFQALMRLSTIADDDLSLD